MNNKIKIVFIFFSIIYFFSPVGFSQASDSGDAIAIRIMENLDHFSPERWYTKQRFKIGSPQSISIDGYEAVRDGRSVYINSSNVISGVLYTNIAILSYNQNAEKPTVSIIEKIVKRLNFNINLTKLGNCRANPVVNCLEDRECAGGDLCDSAKARVVRDTKRLSDLSDIKEALDAYKTKKGYFPKLTAGTYLQYKTLSVWPSWENNLGKELSIELPIDPVNNLGICIGYHPETCWNEQKKSFATTLPALPSTSLVYGYFSDKTGSTYNLCAYFESGYSISGTKLVDPAYCKYGCIDYDGDGYGSPASSVCAHTELDCNDTDSKVAIVSTESTGLGNCNDGIDNDCDRLKDCRDTDCMLDPICISINICDSDKTCESGEDCNSCPGDCGACLPTCPDGTCDETCMECITCYGPSKDCGCGNGKIECGEKCDDGNAISGDGCSSYCLIE